MLQLLRPGCQVGAAHIAAAALTAARAEEAAAAAAAVAAPPADTTWPSRCCCPAPNATAAAWQGDSCWYPGAPAAALAATAGGVARVMCAVGAGVLLCMRCRGGSGSCCTTYAPQLPMEGSNCNTVRGCSTASRQQQGSRGAGNGVLCCTRWVSGIAGTPSMPESLR